MSLPRESAKWPPHPAPIAKEYQRYAELWAARGIGSATDDPDMGNSATLASPASRRVRANVVREIASTVAAFTWAPGIQCRYTTSPDTQDYVEQMLTAGLRTRFIEAGTVASVFGGAFLRLVADPAVTTRPYFTVVEPSRVLPTFVDGYLVAATIWSELEAEGQTVVRFVEHRDNRARTIEYGLYKGTPQNLGKRVPLKSRPETEGLPDAAAYPAGVYSMVEYLPNGLGNPRHTGTGYATSDFAGSESWIALLNLIASEIGRDLRLSRTRVVLPAGALAQTNISPLEREIFTALDGLQLSGQGTADDIQVIQGALRSGDLEQAYNLVKAQIVSDAGYSPQSFGLGDMGTAQSGTALRVRERRTINTAVMKQQLAHPVVERVIQNLCALGNKIFDAKVDAVTPPTVVWPPVVQPDPAEDATRIQTLLAAGAISTETAVRWAQPDLDDDAVAAEVTRITMERGLTMPDPAADPMAPAPGF